MHELFQSINRAHRSLPDLLESVTRALAEEAGLTAASVHLRRGGAMEVRREGRNLVSHWTPKRRPPPPPRAPAAPPSIDDAVHAAEWFEVAPPDPPSAERDARNAGAGADRVAPLTYAQTLLGEVRLSGRAGGRADWLAAFAEQLGLLVMRYEVEAWAARRLGAPMRLVGMGRAVLALEAQLERAARNSLPVLLTGEFGTEKPQLAATIHCGGARRDRPFVEVNCAEPAGPPAEWFARADGGTVFLNGVDELPMALQRQLPQVMRSSVGQWLGGTGAADARIIAASTADLRERVREGRFSQALLAELDFLPIAAPPLRERTEDMEALVEAALERRGFAPDEKRSDALLAACRAYGWPENLFELERVTARLAAMTDGRPIVYDDIVRHTPWILAEGRVRTRAARADPPPEIAPPPPAPEETGPDRWVRCAVQRDEAELSRLHDALRRALVYLGDRYAEPISLGELARQAHVSPSHLSALFRTALDMPFKGLLARIRIHKAKEILTADPRRQITEVALSVGFTDLSHFEKSFRKMVGRSPREFRRGGG